MNQEKLKQYALNLVKITIKKYQENLLDKETMQNFIKENLEEEISKEDYDTVLHIYNRLLAEAGYEIINDVNKFGIINYTSDEYQIYRDNLSQKIK